MKEVVSQYHTSYTQTFQHGLPINRFLPHAVDSTIVSPVFPDSLSRIAPLHHSHLSRTPLTNGWSLSPISQQSLNAPDQPQQTQSSTKKTIRTKVIFPHISYCTTYCCTHLYTHAQLFLKLQTPMIVCLSISQLLPSIFFLLLSHLRSARNRRERGGGGQKYFPQN